VAAIWFYEHSHTYFLGPEAARAKRQALVGRAPSYMGPNRRALFKASLASPSVRPLAARSLVSPGGHGGAPLSRFNDQWQPASSAVEPDSMEPSRGAMEAQIRSLSAKVDILTWKLDDLASLLSRQHNLREEL